MHQRARRMFVTVVVTSAAVSFAINGLLWSFASSTSNKEQTWNKDVLMLEEEKNLFDNEEEQHKEKEENSSSLDWLFWMVNSRMNLPGIADKTRTFVLHPFFAEATDFAQVSKRKVCLATQTSVDRLFWLANTTEAWTGHVSVAVFGPDKELHLAQLAIRILRHCFPETVAKSVSFSLVSDLRHPAENIDPDALIALAEDSEFTLNLCTDIRHTLRTLTRRLVGDELDSPWRTELKYPQNTLRNWAKALCNAEWTLVVDVDMVPSRGMSEQVDEFFADPSNPYAKCTKCVFIVPTYEISEEMRRFPEDKRELVTWSKWGRARVFHIAFWPNSCRSSHLPVWEKVPILEGHIRVAYNITKIEPKYEPIYIGAADAPAYDERFLGYGHDRYTQFYELYLADYSMHMLDNVFTSHWEFQEEKNRPHWRKKQRIQSLKSALHFAEEIKLKYGKDPLNLVGILSKSVRHYQSMLHTKF